MNWAVVDENGRNVFTPEMARCWAWRTAARAWPRVRRQHLGRWPLFAPRMLPALYALTGRPGAPTTSANGSRRYGATSPRRCSRTDRPHLRTSAPGLAPKEVGRRRGDRPARALVSRTRSSSHRTKGKRSRSMFPRRWPPGTATGGPGCWLTLAMVLTSSGELPAADLGGALGWRLKAAQRLRLVRRGGARSRGGRAAVVLCIGWPAWRGSRLWAATESA